MTSYNLTYSSYNQFVESSTKFDFSTFNFENPGICNTLLKLYDQGFSFSNIGEDEKAYVLLFRFIEGYMKLRKTKMYQKDKQFVEKFISGDKITRTMDLLEKLKKKVKEKYEEREKNLAIIKETQIKIDESSDTKNGKDNSLIDKNKTNDCLFEKKSLTPKELISLIDNQKEFKLLIIDTRSSSEFNTQHINFDIVLREEKKKKNTVSYINVPSELIQHVAWETNEIIKKYDRKNELNKNETVSQVFSKRNEFDYLILLDNESSLNTLKIDSKLSILKRAIYDYEISDTKLKNEPLVLDGGWLQWVTYYPGFATKNAKNNSDVIVNNQKTNLIEKKLDFDYPTVDVPSSNKNDKNSTNPQQSQANILKNVAPTKEIKPIELSSESNEESGDEESKINAQIIQGLNNNNSKSINILKPSIDRTVKPVINNNKNQIMNSKVDETNLINKIEISSNDNEDFKKEADKQNITMKPTTNTIIQANLNNNNISTVLINQKQTPEAKKPSVEETRKNLITDQNKPTNLNDAIYNTVYAPTNRFNSKSYQTSYNKDGGSKILNRETGLFNYYPSSFQPPLSQVPIKTLEENSKIVKDGELKFSAPRPPSKPSLIENKLKNEELPSETTIKKPSISNLKRTISSPNIANLDDDDLISDTLNDRNNFKLSNKISTYQRKDSATSSAASSSSSLSSSSSVENLNDDPIVNMNTLANKNIKPQNSHTILSKSQQQQPQQQPQQKAEIKETEKKISNLNINNKPTYTRNNKPMSEHVLSVRLNELDPVYGNAHAGLTGIRNLGNTCFMNSIIQCLSSTEKLVEFFLSGKFKKDLNRTNSLGFRGEIADEFYVIISAMWGGYCRIISPRRFKDIIGQFNEQFITNEQQDAQELLLFLLDGLHEDLNRVEQRPKLKDKEDETEKPDREAAQEAWNTHLLINNSIIVDLFQGQFKSTVVCQFCNKKSVKFDAFMYLTLPILSSKCSIYECLELFLKPEAMRGESKWKCPRCKQYRDAVKKIDIWKLPKILIIHLKRFEYHGRWRDKITTHVDYPIKNLNLQNFVVNQSESRQANTVYQLYATSNHTGTLDGGHYTAMCRNAKYDRWFKYDDTEVKEITDMSSLKTSSSYILFYSSL